MVPLCKGDRRQALVDSAAQASITLGAVVEPSFGPNGLDVLLESADGHMSCCNCGCQILAALSLSHPVGSIISRAVSDYYKKAGDGSKKMLLVLGGAMKEFSSLLEHNYSQVEVSQAVEWLKCTVIPSITALLKEKMMLCRIARNHEELHSILTHVAYTSHYHQFGWKMGRKMADIVQTLLQPTHTPHLTSQSLLKHVQFTWKNMSRLVVLLPGHSLSHSRAIPGLLLDRDLVHPAMMQGWLSERGNAKRLRTIFVLQCSESVSNLYQLRVGTLTDMDEMMEKISQSFQQSVHVLKAANVQLLLCCGKLPSIIRHHLREADIIAIEMVSEDVLQMLAECSSTHPLQSLDDMRMVTAEQAVNLTLSPLEVASRRYLCVQTSPDVELCPVSVVLCGPTTGFCRQSERQLTNTLLVVAAACRDDPLTTVAGGGAWEMAVIRELEIYRLEKEIARHSPRWIAITALQKVRGICHDSSHNFSLPSPQGLLAIPHSLLTSSLPHPAHHSHTATHPTLTPLYANTFTTKSDVPYMGVDCVNGTLQEVDEKWSVQEPLSSHLLARCHLLYAVLSLISQLLRLDLMASAKRPHTLNSDDLCKAECTPAI